MPTYVMGDVQGCYDEMRMLLDQCGFSDGDALWLVGDLVNRGPNNVDTLDFVMSLPDVTLVLGNHDLHLIAVAAGVESARGSDTIDDVLKSSRRDEFVAWLRGQPLIHVDADQKFVMTHAGLPPNWDLETCINRANEVGEVLSSDDYLWFIREMYGNQPDAWSDDLAGADRLRIITNYFTRLRYCTADGQLELISKTDKKPPGFEPWFTFPRPRAEDFTILFGHWAALNGKTGNDRVIALDTGCVWGRQLTVLRLNDGQFFSVESQNR